MIYVIYVFAGIFITLSATMIYVFYRERHFGMFLMGITYGTSGLMAITVAHWWPLLAGFILAWMLKMLGLEMAPEDAAAGAPRDDGATAGNQGGEPRDDGKNRN